MNWSTRFAGVLLGAAVGDALGLPREGLSRRRAAAMFGGSPLRHRLVFGHGMVSDDTGHLCMTAQALLASHGETEAFARSLAWRLRGWLLGVPAGVGLATLRAIIKLWLGFGPAHSGVCSAGNGPAMRAAVIGVWAARRASSEQALRELVTASSRLTHTDERATEGALAVACMARWAAEGSLTNRSPAEVVGRLLERVRGAELRDHLAAIPAAAGAGMTTSAFADGMGLEHGVSGYINHTVPLAVYACLRWPGNVRRAVEDVIVAGGDTDSTGAIVGAARREAWRRFRRSGPSGYGSGRGRRSGCGGWRSGWAMTQPGARGRCRGGR